MAVGMHCPIKGKWMREPWLINTHCILGEKTQETVVWPAISFWTQEDAAYTAASKYASESVAPAVSIKRVNYNKTLAWHCIFPLRLTERESFTLAHVVEFISLGGIFKFRPASSRDCGCFLIAFSNLYLKFCAWSHFDQLIFAAFQKRE